MDYDSIEREVRALAMSLPPSDLGSTRAIQAIAEYVDRKLRGLPLREYPPYERPPQQNAYSPF